MTQNRFSLHCSVALALALPLSATMAQTATHAAAKHAAAKPVEAAPATPSASQIETAKRVNTGKADCEFNQQVSVDPIDGKPGMFKVGYKNQSYTMVPESTTTGAVRLEDKKNGVMWLQIPSKSMLMNSKAGQRMVDNCFHPIQKS